MFILVFVERMEQKNLRWFGAVVVAAGKCSYEFFICLVFQVCGYGKLSFIDLIDVLDYP